MVRDDDSSAAPAHQAQVVRPLILAGAAVVMVVMTAVVVWGVQTTVRSVDELTNAHVEQDAQLETDRYFCLEAAMRARIPLGSRVFNEEPDSLGGQRIAEELTPGYHFVDKPASGSYRVKFTPSGPCVGMGVDVIAVVSP
jgi:hypothetical protein